MVNALRADGRACGFAAPTLLRNPRPVVHVGAGIRLEAKRNQRSL